MFNNLLANQIRKDSSNISKVYLDDKILQYAEDSIKLSLNGMIANLYGNAKIEYQNMQISASIIEINWIEDLSHLYDSDFSESEWGFSNILPSGRRR